MRRIIKRTERTITTITWTIEWWTVGTVEEAADPGTPSGCETILNFVEGHLVDPSTVTDNKNILTQRRDTNEQATDLDCELPAALGDNGLSTEERRDRGGHGGEGLL
jgi:hypothetical protein